MLLKMRLLVLFIGFCGQCLGMPMPTPATDTMTTEQVQSYLEQYRYMGDDMPSQELKDMYRTNLSAAFRKGIELFQERYQQSYNLTVTGELDADTLALMNTSRCGVADMMTMQDMTKRKKRYNHFGTMWQKTDLTYKINSYPTGSPMTNAEVDEELIRAIMIWQAVTPLTFTRSNSNTADIIIEFKQGAHGDGSAFDGPGRTLAHAFFPTSNPIGGDSHFDDAETFTLNIDSGVNLFQVAAHEFGHALGLAHSDDSTALMAPFYPGYIPQFQLPSDDIQGIQSLYGPRPPTASTAAPPASTTSPSEPQTMGPATSLCNDPKFDALTYVFNSAQQVKLYGFKGNLYFLLDNGLFYPEIIQDTWSVLPVDIDAALYWEPTYTWQWTWDSTNRRWNYVRTEVLPPATYIFKGDQYWEIKDMTVTAGPLGISEWGIPADIDAAFVWKPNGKTYFFKGRNYYRYTEGQGVDAGYPRDISVWGNNLPAKIDAVVSSQDRTYFFSGDMYYLYGDAERMIIAENKIEATWFVCSRFSDYSSSTSTGVANYGVNCYIILLLSVLAIVRNMMIN